MAWLVMHSGIVHELRPGTSAIGRDPSCEVPVDDTACSRRHAFVHHLGERGIFLEDGGSLNGTQLDGRDVKTRVLLREGARIHVGNTFLIYRETKLTDSGAHALRRDPFETVHLNGVNGHMGGVGFSGNLAAIDLIEVLQLLVQSKRTGTLEVALPDGAARLDLVAGEVVAASLAGVRGVPAVFALMLRREGVFRLRQADGSPPRPNVTIPTQQLLFELCRVLDEHDAEATP